MANFNELKQKAKDTIETIADKSVELYKVAEEKTKLLAKITKLSADITFEKGDLRKLYRELGKMYYDRYKDNPDTDLAQSCTEITATLERISVKQKEIDVLRGFAEYEPVAEDEDVDADTGDVDIIVDEYDASAPGHTNEAFRSVQDTDTIEEPEGDAEPGKAPPTFRL